MKIMFLLMFLFAAIPMNRVVKISSFNVYSLDVQLEVKCDFNNKTNKFEYHRFFTVPGKKHTTIIVPNTVKDCQIWPKIKWW